VFWDVWNDFKDYPDMWIGILTGIGERAFSAGNDLYFTSENPGNPEPPAGFSGITNRF
jgi:enoyl-CoA hydratase/carnithine racemase